MGRCSRCREFKCKMFDESSPIPRPNLLIWTVQDNINFVKYCWLFLKSHYLMFCFCKIGIGDMFDALDRIRSEDGQRCEQEVSVFGTRQCQKDRVDQSIDFLTCDTKPCRDSSRRLDALNAMLIQLHLNFAAREVSSGVDQRGGQENYLPVILSCLRSSQASAESSSHQTPAHFLSEFASDDLWSETMQECDPRLSAETDRLLQLECQASAIAADLLQGLDHETCLSRAQVEAVTRRIARMFEPARQKLAAATRLSAAYDPSQDQVSPQSISTSPALSSSQPLTPGTLAQHKIGEMHAGNVIRCFAGRAEGAAPASD
jgi:hypothetical protein